MVFGVVTQSECGGRRLHDRPKPVASVEKADMIEIVIYKKFEADLKC